MLAVLKRRIYLLLAVLLGVAGLITLPLPLPLGVPLLAAAAIILLSQSFWARRRYIELRLRTERYPKLQGLLMRLEKVLRPKKLLRSKRRRRHHHSQ